MAAQVEATIIKIDGNPAFPTPISMSFPTDEIKMQEVVSGTINSSIQWNGALYYASETLADLIEAANAGGGSSYLVYTALLSQSGTSAPVATVLENTLGGTVVWGYSGVGTYTATKSGAFTLNKTFFSTLIPEGSLTVAFVLHPFQTNVDEVGYFAYDVASSLTNGAPCFVEIRVYP